MINKNNNFALKFKMTNKKLVMEIEFKDLVELFHSDPENVASDGEELFCKVKRGKRKEFAELVVSRLQEEADQETGEPLWSLPFSQAFQDIFESAEDDICTYTD